MPTGWLLRTARGVHEEWLARTVALHEAVRNCNTDSTAASTVQAYGGKPLSAATLWQGALGLFNEKGTVVSTPAFEQFFVRGQGSESLAEQLLQAADCCRFTDISPLCLPPWCGAIGEEARGALGGALAELPASSTILPYYPRVLILRQLGRDMPAHILTQEVHSYIGSVGELLTALPEGLHVAVYETHDG